ncbi:MAG: hypothetical protein M0Z58_05380 [Nitrospiraceae bacterium]|nr:hypothetical protein [Nitrospiraceae bacterium]
MPGTITIRVPGKLRRDPEKIVRAEKTSKSDAIIRDALERYVAPKRFQRLRKPVLPFAEAEVLSTGEDIFKALS